ncbi:MAG: 16S rRNA (cytosine(967)-C(5))-methyltransferase RsmB [Deltaproteobacteria bacterium]|nr:16S rRNA (cytosine(967)-C(5))-methyltransferase RsmB [Deltaproteobacteria bacterium]
MKTGRSIINSALNQFEKDFSIISNFDRITLDKDRRFAKEVFWGVIRNKSFIDFIIGQFTRKKPKKNILNILRMGIYQLYFIDKVPQYAALSETVSLAKTKEERGFINAVLRKLSKLEKKSFQKKPSFLEEISIQCSHPLWLTEKWNKLFDFEKTLELSKINNEHPVLTFRIHSFENSFQNIKNNLLKKLPSLKEGVWAQNSFTTQENISFLKLSEFKSGNLVIQNEASQLVALALDPKSHETIIDACASPGVKTAHISQMMGNKGTILSIDKKESLKMKENMERLHIKNVQFQKKDLYNYPPSKGGDLLPKVEKILLDAPCSGWGIIRHHPEIKWRQKPEDIEKLAELQKKIRDNLLPFLKKGGVFVYAVCTFSKEETLDFVEDTLKKYPTLKLQNLKDFLPKPCHAFIDMNGCFLSTPLLAGPDGFFIARFISVERC